MSTNASLLDLTIEELTEQLASAGQPDYRARQVWHWLYREFVVDPGQMTNLPQALREQLKQTSTTIPLSMIAERTSRDQQTRKWLFRLHDGPAIETVLMLYDQRRTVCISSQAGCAMGCHFCATGQGGLARNLSSGEIVAQVLAAARWLATPPAGTGLAPSQLSNVVIMGMGEPFANYDRVWQAIRRITDKTGLNLGSRHITLSTVGLPQGIRRMAEEPLQVNLAVSLHAPTDTLRNQLVPANLRYPLDDVLQAVRFYIARTNRRVTFEYALMRGINDTPQLARELVRLLDGLLCHVNLIPLNPVDGSLYQPTHPQDAQLFLDTLVKSGVPATMRLRRGLDIDAGCGQLRARATTD